jgi:hypothetical protein
MSDFMINTDQNLSAINLYSSSGYTLSSNVAVNNVCIVAALSTTTTGYISGRSASFDILPKTGKHTFFKHGEEIDYGGVVNSYILQESINQHPRLESMINAVFGEFSSLPEAVGKIIHEKISNFASNNADLDICGVSPMYSLAEEVNAVFSNYNLSYPGGVRRLVDTLSVGINKLVGDRLRYDDDFTDETVFEADNTVRYGRNLGTTQLSTTGYMVTAGNPIVVKELWGNNMFKVVPSYISGNTTDPNYTVYANISGLSSYPLSAYDTSWNWGLMWPDTNTFDDYYEFYNYIDNTSFPLTSFPQSHGLVNWDDTNKLTGLTTLKESATSYTDWYSKDGIIDASLEYALRNGLKLIDD